MGKKLRYSEIAPRIDVESLEAALEWSPEFTDEEEDRGYCIFPENHQNGDTTGKFSINREKKVWGCWVCGGGSLLDLAMEVKNLDEDEALVFLLQYCDDARSDSDFVDDFLAMFEDAEHRVKTLPYFNEKVLERWPLAFEVEFTQSYLGRRYISEEMANGAGLRFAESYRKPSPPGGKFADDKDFYGPALIIPHYWQERLVGWQARSLTDERPEWVPKYINTHDFPKEHTIYGFHWLVHQHDMAVVVESPMSALFLWSLDIPAVATFGDSVNDPQLRLLRRFQRGVYLWPDNDKAGRGFLKRASEYLLPYVPVYQVPFVGGEKSDPGDLVQVAGGDLDDIVMAYLENATLLDVPAV
jgi:hypothetical protein